MFLKLVFLFLLLYYPFYLILKLEILLLVGGDNMRVVCR